MSKEAPDKNEELLNKQFELLAEKSPDAAEVGNEPQVTKGGRAVNQNKKPSRKPDWDATTITIICILITVLNVSLVVFQILWWLLR